MDVRFFPCGELWDLFSRSFKSSCSSSSPVASGVMSPMILVTFPFGAVIEYQMEVELLDDDMLMFDGGR